MMQRKSVHILTVSIFMLFGLVTGFAEAKVIKEKYESPLTVEIKMKKDTFRIGERVDGMVLIKNSHLGSPSAAFYIKLYREGRLFSQVKTSLKVPVGTTKFTFKEFGIPDFNDQPGAQATWKIWILQENVRENYGAEAIVHIVPPAIRDQDEIRTKKRKVY